MERWSLGLRRSEGEQNEPTLWFIFWLNFDVNSNNNGLRRCLVIADRVVELFSLKSVWKVL